MVEFSGVSVFMLIKDGKLLVEKRKLSKKSIPGTTVIPGGSIESEESPEESMLRELKEELGVISLNHHYLCTLLHRIDGELMMFYYFVVDSWDGTIQKNEAEELFWISLDDLSSLSFEIDKVAVHEYERLNF